MDQVWVAAAEREPLLPQ